MNFETKDYPLKSKGFITSIQEIDSYDFEESSYGELEVAAAFHKSVYNMISLEDL